MTATSATCVVSTRCVLGCLKRLRVGSSALTHVFLPAGLLLNVAALLDDQALAPLASELLQVTQHETQWRGDAVHLTSACREAAAAIAVVVPSAQQLKAQGLPMPLRRRGAHCAGWLP